MWTIEIVMWPFRVRLPRQSAGGSGGAVPFRLIAHLVARIRPGDFRVKLMLGGDAALWAMVYGLIAAVGIRASAQFRPGPSHALIHVRWRVAFIIIQIWIREKVESLCNQIRSKASWPPPWKIFATWWT